MKTWQLVLVQLWVLCFAPVWAFVLVFAPLTLAPPNPAWSAFLLLSAPPLLATVASIALWVARAKRHEQWQRRIAAIMIILPPLTVIPLFIFE